MKVNGVKGVIELVRDDPDHKKGILYLCTLLLNITDIYFKELEVNEVEVDLIDSRPEIETKVRSFVYLLIYVEQI
jgi:hypothetical protein